jgi:hypothetical protein
MIRMAAFALLFTAVVACEDDSLYRAGPANFQNDTLDGGAGGTRQTDGAADGSAGDGSPPTGGTGGVASGTAG